MSEKLNMKWTHFQENLISTFGKLRTHNNFSDVTLVCEDGHMVESHKLILASSSAFFRNIFTSNTLGHPFIYLRGVKEEHLTGPLNFVYTGEALINKTDLETFLSLGRDLEIEGIQDDNNTGTESELVNENNHSTQQEKRKLTKSSKSSNNTVTNASFRKTANQQMYETLLEKRCAANKCDLCKKKFPTKNDLVEHTVREHQGKPQKRYKCKKCRVIFRKSDAKQHECDNVRV